MTNQSSLHFHIRLMVGSCTVRNGNYIKFLAKFSGEMEVDFLDDVLLGLHLREIFYFLLLSSLHDINELSRLI